MVQFGQTLNDIVKTNWRCHAVPYMELKCALRTSSSPKDDNSVHTESSYTISDSQKATFAKIYDDSVVRLVEFYENKTVWAERKSAEMGREVTECLDNTAEGTDISNLIDRVQGFSKEVGLMLEFLELNAMAFSKIMKKVRVFIQFVYLHQ
jgi:SPX domain protein involved in polyphosphate accumulation